jgi:hypothetical protein
MELLRVVIDSGDPCSGCGSPTTVFQRSTDDAEWVDEHRECSHGCDELASYVLPSAPLQRSRRRAKVA